MLLELGHQQDLGLLLFSYVKAVCSGMPLPRVWTTKVKARATREDRDPWADPNGPAATIEKTEAGSSHDIAAWELW